MRALNVLVAVAIFLVGVLFSTCDAGHDRVDTVTSALVSLDEVAGDAVVVFALNPHPMIAEQPVMVTTLPRWAAPMADFDDVDLDTELVLGSPVYASAMPADMVMLETPNKLSIGTLPEAIQTASYNKRFLIALLSGYKGGPSPCPPVHVSLFGPDIIQTAPVTLLPGELVEIESALDGVCETASCETTIGVKLTPMDPTLGPATIAVRLFFVD